MAAPSLFSSTRCVVVRGLEHLPDESVDGLLDYAAAPAEDVALVLVHGGGPKGSGVLTKLRKLAAVTEVKSAEIKRGRASPASSPSEVRRPRRARSTTDAAAFLVTAVGQDLRSLAAAAHQLTNDFPGEPLTVDKVKRYFGGRAEAKSFAVADAAFCGPPRGRARGAALGAGRRHRPGAGHLGDGRLGARPGALPRRPAGCARPTWPARSASRRGRCAGPRPVPRRGPRGGSPPRIRAVATADADIKGAAHDASYTLERLVLTVAGLRDPLTDAAPTTDVTTPRCASADLSATNRSTAGVDGSSRAGPQREAAFLAIADLRFAAWFLWMTPLEAALSSLLAASRPAASGGVLVAGLGGLAELAHGGLQAGLDGLVALVTPSRSACCA